jgi:hypothetical protein
MPAPRHVARNPVRFAGEDIEVEGEIQITKPTKIPTPEPKIERRRLNPCPDVLTNP